ncbi:H repeat-associated putative transposase YdcC [Geodia barretti]|uniref:H repeat-associated putative transposase YdcC n=1 Tax=Geodia barretti TaxID=519541 RepID=A0AA35XCS6_GEOBA|nr:H repeat-associated putative transposase YdcC [Geodia barretti]
MLPGEVVAIDGKTARRSYDRAGEQGEPCIWTAEKSNEITAIPQLLDLLDLHGCIVTIDGMGCQREIAQQITDGGANYVLAVKENQGQLHEGIRDLFEGAGRWALTGCPTTTPRP